MVSHISVSIGTDNVAHVYACTHRVKSMFRFDSTISEQYIRGESFFCFSSLLWSGLIVNRKSIRINSFRCVDITFWPDRIFPELTQSEETLCVYGYVCKRPFEHLSIILKYLLDFDWVLCWFNIDFNMLCLPFLISLFQSFCTLTSIYSIFIAFAIGSTTFSATLAWYWTLSQ